MATLVVTDGPVNHDGAEYNEGDQFTVANEAADELVALGVAVLVCPPTKAKEAKGG
jgi:hypothetical protein